MAEEEEEGGLGDYAGLVARAVLEETMAERTWSVPCNSSPQQGDAHRRMFKGIDRPFQGGVESILIRSLLVNWRLGYFLNLILKGLPHKISKKPLDAA